jgi:hypothetical protein
MARKVKSSLLRGSGPPARLHGPATEAEDDDAAPLRLGGPVRRIHISGDCKGLRPGPAARGLRLRPAHAPASLGVPRTRMDRPQWPPMPRSGPRSSRKRRILS